MENNRYSYINIRTYLDDSESAQELKDLIKDYSCPLNPDVEHFFKFDAIDFSRRNQSVTYLVFSTSDGTLLGYFTIALKAITIRIEQISNTVSKKLHASQILMKSQKLTLYPLFLLHSLAKTILITQIN